MSQAIVRETHWDDEMSKLWNYDLSHVGRLFRYIREARKMEQKEIAALSGTASLSNDMISKLETELSMSRTTIDGYLEVLQSENVGHTPLSDEDVEIIRSLVTHSKERDSREQLLREFNPRMTRSSGERVIKQLVSRMRKMDGPALIMDPLWCIHAINGALLRLFDLSPNSNYLEGWDAWHALGTKITSHSPAVNAHSSVSFFSYSVSQYFRNEHVNQFLFTPQMRSLIYRLHQLSESNNSEFSARWIQAITFTDAYKESELKREMKCTLHGKLYEFSAYPIVYEAKELRPGAGAYFTLAGWEPVDEGQQAFEVIAGMENSSEIYYAARYDSQDEPLHPNDWPETNRIASHHVT